MAKSLIFAAVKRKCKAMIVNIKTSKGDIKVRLYDETPVHRDNFLRLVGEGTYRDTLFHRVIKDFMVQGGDPESKSAPAGKPLGSGDVGYTLEAEIAAPVLYHKRGALAAARTGDEVNPERRSSGCQFYIVTGKKYSERELKKLESQINDGRVAEVFNREARKHYDLIKQLRMRRDRAGLEELERQLTQRAIDEVRAGGLFAFTEEQRRDYVTVGGAPFLDGQYTVFGEVVEGMDVVDAIEGVATDKRDRPLEDVRIIDVEAYAQD